MLLNNIIKKIRVRIIELLSNLIHKGKKRNEEKKVMRKLLRLHILTQTYISCKGKNKYIIEEKKVKRYLLRLLLTEETTFSNPSNRPIKARTSPYDALFFVVYVRDIKMSLT